MAIDHSINLLHLLPRRAVRVRAQSVSFTGTAGDPSSFRTLEGPTRLKSMRAVHTEPANRDLELMVTDGDGITYMVLARMNVPAGRAVYWVGDLPLPAGWRVYAKFYGMTGGTTNNNWQWYGVAERRATFGGI